MTFQPKRVYFEQEARDYALGEKLYNYFQRRGIQIKIVGSHNRVTGIPGKTPQEAYMEGKRTLVVGVRRTLKFSPCKPSAHYQLPLCTSCPGKCEYCYLNTTLGYKPYIRVYVNVDEILDRARAYIEERTPETTFFEGAATSDPVPVEKFTGSLQKTIEFFGRQPLGRFRFVTKFTDVDPLLETAHGGHTTFRFSLNTAKVIRQYEHDTPGAEDRIATAGRVARAGYPLGFLIAPIFIYESWQQDYGSMLASLRSSLPEDTGEVSFELITHRFTASAKRRIEEVFPATSLPMKKEDRKFKYGQFGYGKYVYSKEQMEEIKEFFHERIEKLFPEAEIKYLV